MRKVLLTLLLALGLAGQTPRVLIIGDSISIGYTPFVQKLLAGQAEVVHNQGNAAHSATGVAKVDGWIGAGGWKVIAFNFGLQGLKIMDSSRRQVSLDEYASNLAYIARKLKATGARVVFIATTPVPEGNLKPPRKPGDELLYNEAATRVMAREGIETVDLYAEAARQPAGIQLPANVHFTPAGYEALAAPVAAAIRARLKQRSPPVCHAPVSESPA